MKKELLASAPWRGEEQPREKFADAKLKATNEPGGTPTMHIPRKKRSAAASKTDEDLEAEIDPELRYSFQRNFRVIYSAPPNPLSPFLVLIHEIESMWTAKFKSFFCFLHCFLETGSRFRCRAHIRLGWLGR
ncbi:hypothetical protein GW17_00036390 [Ensete ventricosum]|nr:hypothetical protein GW17_00036390 [Ensete ventricosum]